MTLTELIREAENSASAFPDRATLNSKTLVLELAKHIKKQADTITRLEDDVAKLKKNNPSQNPRS